jgi:hypothetical protein
MNYRKIFQSLTLTGFIFGFAGWFYIAQNAVFHPRTLAWPLTHLLPFPREDTFGAVCFGVSLICCFVYNLIKDTPVSRPLVQRKNR